MNTDLAFQGVKKVMSEQLFAFATEKKIMVVGLGGVGSWVVESLVRSGFRNLILVDLDEICVSNTNRQIHTLQSTVGLLKAEALKNRALDINPDCEIEIVADFFQKDNIKDYLIKYQPDIVVDAIDSLGIKCEMAAMCKELDIELLVSGSAGGRMLATELKVSDLSQTYEDDLLHQMRKRLRQKHRFPRGKRKFKISCVFSSEPKKVCEINGSENLSGRLDCQTGLGSLCHVTASMGLILSQMVWQHFLTKMQSMQELQASEDGSIE